jgi:hypothetical protein
LISDGVSVGVDDGVDDGSRVWPAGDHQLVITEIAGQFINIVG